MAFVHSNQIMSILNRALLPIQIGRLLVTLPAQLYMIMREMLARRQLLLGETRPLQVMRRERALLP